MNKEVFYQVTSGNQTLPVYDVDAHKRIAAATTDLNGLSGKVTELSGKHEALDEKVDLTIDDLEALSAKHEALADDVEELSGKHGDLATKVNAIDENLNELSGKFETLSGDFDNLTDAVDEIDRDLDALSAEYKEHAANDVIHVSQSDRDRWDEVTKMVYSSAFENYKQDVTQEFVNTSAWANDTFQPAGDYVSASTFQAYREETSAALDTKLNIADTINWDKIPYSGGYAIEINDHVIHVVGDLFVTQTELENELKNYYTSAYINEHYYTAEEVDEKIANFGGFQVVPLGSNGKPNPPEAPKHNIIYLTKTEGTTKKDPYEEWIFNEDDEWDCIGEMSVPLDDYYTKTEIDGKFTDVSAWANETFQPVGQYATSAYVDEAVDELAGEIEAKFGDLHNTTVKAGYGIKVTSVSDPITEDVEYTIETDPSVLNYGLFNTNQTITYVSPSTVLGFATNGDIQGENISLDTTTHQISLEPGSYHIDIQVNANIDGSNCALTNAYYDGILTAGPSPIRTVRMSIDGSYVHTETFTLSYDIKIEETATLTFTMSGLPSGCQCSATLNIHEILTLEAAAEAISNNYTAGDGMKLENKSFSVNQGDGLEITQDNKLQVKLGNGLSFTDDHGIQAISIDPEGDVAEVVETVQELENAIATKITTNYPPAMITDSHAQVMAGTQYTPGNGGCLYGTLFNTPITHPVAIDKTFLGIYAYNGGIKAILGVYEYQPDYERKDGTGAVTGFGRTVPLCDTGIITISQGFHEYPVKHLNNTIGGANPETTPELKTNCMYYATIYLGYASTAGANDLQVGCAAGYSPQYGDIKPAMSMANVNNIKANIDVPEHAAYTEDLSFNDMGFNWQYTSYPERSSYSASTYFEASQSPRMYMQIRNIK